METNVCPLCHARDAAFLFTGSDRLYGGPGRFSVWRCRSCGVLYLAPRPAREEMAAYYPDEYVPYASGRYLSAWQQWNLRLAVAKQVRAVTARMPQPGRALDVGCATGDFLAALRRTGWEVLGVEINPRIAAYARETTGIPVLAGSLAEAALDERSFDLITFWDVLEHLPDPKGALLEAARITRPAGMLVLSLPNPDSLEARLFGPNWAGWDIPRHLWWFPKATLSRLLAQSGWDVQEFVCLRGRHWLLALSLRLWLEDRAVPTVLRRGILALFRSLPVRMLWWPYFAIVEKAGAGSIMVAFARRRKVADA